MPRIDGNSALPLTSSMRQLNLRTEPPINVEDRLLAQDDAIRDIQNNLSDFQKLEERTKEKLAEVQESFQRSLNWDKNQCLEATEIQSQRIEKVRLQFKKQLNQIHTQFYEQIDDLRGGVIATFNEHTKLEREFNQTHSQLTQKISANNEDISMTAEEQEHFIAQQAKQIRVLRDEVDVLASKNTQLEAQQDELRAGQARQNAEVQKELAQIKKQLQELLQSKDGIHHIG